MISRASAVLFSARGSSSTSTLNRPKRKQRPPTKACHRIGLALLLVFALPMGAGAVSIFEGAGPDAASILGTVNDFRAALGNPNNANAPGPLPSGRREINWDGGGDATTVSPTSFTGFLNTRGALFTTPGAGFAQAPPSGGPQGGLATLFSNPTYSDFDTFSAPRLFTPIGGTLTNVTFFTPGTNGGVPANVTGFGAVFSDVDFGGSATLTFVNADGVSLGTFPVPPANDGLSFLGLIFPGELIGQINIISGNSPLGPNDGFGVDIVLMDDFLYSEPSPVPEPTTLLLFGTTVAGLGLARWRQRRGKQSA